MLSQLLSSREYRDYAWGHREEVNDLHLPHVRELPQVLPDLFAAAAERAREAGFDGVELHFANAYTMASFLSRTNMRDDGYGGSPEGRLRMPLEVLAEVRSRVGNDWWVGTRFLGDEAIDAGTHIEDAVGYGLAFAKAGFDFLSISKGGKFDDAKQPSVGAAAYPYTGPSGHECMPTVRGEALVHESPRCTPRRPIWSFPHLVTSHAEHQVPSPSQVQDQVSGGQLGRLRPVVG